ncbi:MAG TPA: TolC family protein [Longimicrobiales bacterium]|nr:TolC family protein [Longimicrobiales bacterium]
MVAALFGARAEAQEGPRGGDPQAFWRLLGDTTLERLVSQAIDANQDLRAAESRLQGARAARTTAALDLAPVVTAGAGYSRQRLASAALPGAAGRLPEQDLWDTNVQLSWELDVFGRLRNTLRGQNALLASAEADTRDVQVLLGAAIAREYFALRGAQDRLAFARRNAENQLRTLEITQERLEAGSGTALDTERAQAQLSSTLAAIPLLESAVSASQYRIAVLLGRPPETIVGERADSSTVPVVSFALSGEERDALLRARPDVRSAASRHSAERAFVGAAKSAYLPRLSIGAVAGYTANSFDALGDAGPPRYAVGPVISWPFLDIGRVKSNVDAAHARENEAAARYRQTVLDADAELETSLTGYEKARERLQHLEDAAAASERATDLARLRFEEGGTDFIEVLDAERRQLEAQDRLAEGRSETSAWLVSVYRALGGGAPAGLR